MSGVDGPLTWSIKRPADQRKLCVGPARSDSFMHASLMRSFSLSTWNSILFFSATKPLPRCTHQIYIGLCVSIGNFCLSSLMHAARCTGTCPNDTTSEYIEKVGIAPYGRTQMTVDGPGKSQWLSG